MEALAVMPAVSLAKVVLETLLGWAETAVADKVALVRRVREDVQSIHDELGMMHALLRSRPSSSPGYTDGGGCHDVHTQWVKQLRDLAFDIEDGLLDLMLIKGPAELAARIRNADPIRDLKARVEGLHLRNQRYYAYLPTDRSSAHHDQHGSDDDPAALLHDWRHQDIVGRDGDKKALARLVCQTGKTVVAVWGKAGVGKSSLARMLYDDADLVDRFDRREWVTLPHPLESDEPFRRLLEEQLGLGMDGGAACLVEKRCLVVVDDVSSREDWELISPYLADKCAGTRVVVTTQGKDVALQCASGTEDDVYELKPLTPREAKKLLYHKVYKNSKYKLPYGIAKLISKRCQGRPLAIATIGGLLADIPKESVEWTNLQEHLKPGLESDDLDVRRVISMNYDGLPYHVKFCLLYMSIFPENREIRHTRLLRRWMAEVYMEKPGNMTLEEVARSHHTKLIKRRMIEPSNKARASMTSECCTVHGLVLQLILPKSIEENQLFIVDKLCNEVPQSNVRHLVVKRWKGHEEKMSDKNLMRLRSLTVFGKCPVSLINHKMRFLRILDLEDTIGLKNEDLKEIGKLPHLRYLGLRGTNISRLPSSLENLRFLETLDVKDTKVTHLPDGIIKPENLCYLRVGTNFATEKMRSRKDVHKRNKNRASGSEDQIIVRTPKEIEKLSNLQVLGVVHIACRQEAIERGKLTKLWKLGVDLAVAREGGRELCSSIARLDKLERLEVQCESLEFLKDMKEPVLRCLQSIRLCGHLGCLPGWMSSINNLSKIKLQQTRLKQEDIVVIGSLPNVIFLGLWKDSFAEESLCFDKSTFLNLRLLDIDGLEVKAINIKYGALPALEKLRVSKCLELYDSEKGLSSVKYLQNLKEVDLTDCGDKLGLEKALRQQIRRFFNRPVLITGKYVVTWIEMVLTNLYRLLGWE